MNGVGGIKPGLMEMFQIQFVCDEEEIVILRQVTTLIDILSLAGGFASIIMLLTKIVSLFYNKALLE